MKVTSFRVLKKRLDAAERKIGDRKRRLEKSEPAAEVNNFTNSIRDRERLRIWFEKFVFEQNEKNQRNLNEKSIWNKFKETVLDNSYMKWKPLVTADGRSPQAEFLLSNELEVLYGGAAGGGKTAALLMGALQYVEKPGFIALLLRRTFSDLGLPKSLMDLSHICLKDTKAKWNEKNHCYSFPSGARLVFGYCNNPGDEERYKSAEFQYIGVDELTEWHEKQYKFLFSRLRRSTDLDIPVRMRCATNPGGEGHEWVKRRFLMEDSKAERKFIPARLFDNPRIDQDLYRQCLMNLDPIRRMQILDGNWDINPEGGKFQRGWFRIFDNYPRGYRVIRYWDKAATEPKNGKDPDWTVGVLATMVDGIFYVIDVVRFRGTPKLNEDTIRQTAEMDGKRVDIYIEQEPGSAGVNDIDHYARRVLAGYPLRKSGRTTGSKEIRANPLSSAAEQGNVRLLKGNWNRDFLDEIELFPHGAHDDIVDASSGAFSKLTEHVPLGGSTVPRLFGD